MTNKTFEQKRREYWARMGVDQLFMIRFLETDKLLMEIISEWNASTGYFKIGDKLLHELVEKILKLRELDKDE